MATEAVTTDLKTQILSAHNELLNTVERYATEIKGLDGRIEATVQSKFDKLNARLDELEIKAFRPAQTSYVTEKLAKDFNPERKSAFEAYLRKGERSISPEHVKLLTEGDPQGGGFFAVPEYANDIIKSIILISNIRQVARVRTTSTNSIKYPKRTATFAASWTAEAQQQTEANGLRYGMEEIPNHAMTAFADISMEDLEDPMFDMAAQLNEEFSEQFAKAEGTAFVIGSGKGQPEGFMGNTSIAYDPTTNASSFSQYGDEFTNCAYNLKTAYANEATWLMNRQTIGKIRLIKDQQGRPLWLPFTQSSLQDKAGPTIVGIPYLEVPDMPNVGAGLFPVALGAWKKAYIIVDRLQINVVRDGLTQATKGVVRFTARKRVGGQLVLAEGVRKIRCSVS